MLVACTPSGKPAPVAEVVAPTVELLPERAATPRATPTASATPLALATATVPPTPSPTETATATVAPPETLTPLPMPTWMPPPYFYPDPNAPTATPFPSPTPQYTTDGTMQFVTKSDIRFEIPIDWFITPRRITNYLPIESDEIYPTFVPRAEPYLTLEYNALGYHKYNSDSYREQGYTPITVAGYPALIHSEYSAPWLSCYFSLIVETPEKVYLFFLYHPMSPNPQEGEVQAALARGESIIQRIRNSFQLLTLPAGTIPIESQRTITGTVAAVDTLYGRTITLEPSPHHPFTELVVWYGPSKWSRFVTPSGEDLVMRNVKVGDTVEVLGRPLSEHEILGDTVIVRQAGVQGRYTEPVRYEGEVVGFQPEYNQLSISSPAYPYGLVVVQISEQSVILLPDLTESTMPYTNIPANSKITVVGYAKPDHPNDVLAEQLILSP